MNGLGKVVVLGAGPTGLGMAAARLPARESAAASAPAALFQDREPPVGAVPSGPTGLGTAGLRIPALGSAPAADPPAGDQAQAGAPAPGALPSGPTGLGSAATRIPPPQSS